MGKIIFPAQIGGVDVLLEILGNRDEVVARLVDYADVKKLRALF